MKQACKPCSSMASASVPALSYCPDVPLWESVTWELEDEIKPFLSNLILAMMVYHSISMGEFIGVIYRFMSDQRRFITVKHIQPWGLLTHKSCISDGPCTDQRQYQSLLFPGIVYSIYDMKMGLRCFKTFWASQLLRFLCFLRLIIFLLSFRRDYLTSKLRTTQDPSTWETEAGGLTSSKTAMIA